MRWLLLVDVGGNPPECDRTPCVAWCGWNVLVVMLRRVSPTGDGWRRSVAQQRGEALEGVARLGIRGVADEGA